MQTQQNLHKFRSPLNTSAPLQSKVLLTHSTKKVVLVDIDDTVAITSPTWTALTEQFMADRGHKRIIPSELDTYRIEDSFDFPDYLKPAYFQFMYQNMPWSSLPVNPDAINFVNSLDNTHTVEFVTSRPQGIADVTRNWIEQHFGNHIIHFQDVPTRIADYLVDNSQKRISLYKEYNPSVRAFLYNGILTEQFPEVPDFSGFSDLFEIYKHITEDE